MADKYDISIKWIQNIKLINIFNYYITFQSQWQVFYIKKLEE